MGGRCSLDQLRALERIENLSHTLPEAFAIGGLIEFSPGGLGNVLEQPGIDRYFHLPPSGVAKKIGPSGKWNPTALAHQSRAHRDFERLRHRSGISRCAPPPRPA